MKALGQPIHTLKQLTNIDIEHTSGMPEIEWEWRVFYLQRKGGN